MSERIVICEDGTIEAVYSDQLADLAIGPAQVERFSNVEFNEATQKWEARRNGEVLCSHPIRGKCLEMEHEIATDSLTEREDAQANTC